MRKKLALLLVLTVLFNLLSGMSLSAYAAGSAVSNSIIITEQPADVVCAVGETALFTVTAEGEGLTYQWYYKNPGKAAFSLHKGQTANTCSLEMTEARNGRLMYCKITDAIGKALKTETVTMTIAEAPEEPAAITVTAQPQDVSCAVGETATFTVTAKGEGLTYQWFYKNPGKTAFALHKGQTANTCSLEMTSSRNGRLMYCVIADKYGNSVQTDTVTMTVSEAPEEPAVLSVTSQPLDVTCPEGNTATFTVTAEGEGLTYRWYYKNPGKASFTLYKGQTENTCSLEMTEARNGRQQYCVITDKYGSSVRTDTVSMTLQLPFAITAQPQSVICSEGETAVFTAAATGEGLTYQWYYKNPTGAAFKAITGAIAASYSCEMTEARNGRQMYCIITDKDGNTLQTDTVTMTLAVIHRPVLYSLGASTARGRYTEIGSTSSVGTTKYSYSYWIAEQNNLELVNLGVSSSGYAAKGGNTAEEKGTVNGKTVVDRNDFSDASYILIAYGQNDYKTTDESVHLGSMESAVGDGTVIGNMKYMIETLSVKAPSAKIIILLPDNQNRHGDVHLETGWSYGYAFREGKTLTDYKAAIRECAEAYNLTVLDAEELTSLSNENIRTCLGDGLHPTLAFHKEMGLALAPYFQ